MTRRWLARSAWLLAAVLGSALPWTTPAKAVPSAWQPPSTGRLKLVTYNVAGLPEGISASTPSLNMPLIGGLVEDYDLVLIQEDFAYPFELRSTIRHPFSSPAFIRGNALHFGDGLSQFARFPFSNLKRQAWTVCHGYLEAGNDCLTPKGFTFARHMLAAGLLLDVYNLHMDSGGSRLDGAARAAQLEQLAAAVVAYSANQAVIVAGDTNLGSAHPSSLERFMMRTLLVEVCTELRCAEPRRIDRVLFRSSPVLKLEPLSWRTDGRFVDQHGYPLSDHLAVAVEFRWQATAHVKRVTKRSGSKRRASAAARSRDGTSSSVSATRNLAP